MVKTAAKKPTKISEKSEKVTRQTRISKEIKRLESLLNHLPADKIKTVKSLIENAAFMTITLEDLQDSMNKNGVITEYQNGANQWGTKKSPEVEIYNTMIKNHLTVMKQLVELLPENETNKSDALLEFLKAN